MERSGAAAVRQLLPFDRKIPAAGQENRIEKTEVCCGREFSAAVFLCLLKIASEVFFIRH